LVAPLGLIHLVADNYISYVGYYYHSLKVLLQVKTATK